MAERIQRKRRGGWKAPTGAVYVGRGTRWGNPWRVARAEGCNAGPEVHSQWRSGQHWHAVWPDGEHWCYPDKAGAFERVVEVYRLSLLSGLSTFAVLPTVAEVREQLAGKDLMCWCAPDLPCHADVLLAVANGGGQE